MWQLDTIVSDLKSILKRRKRLLILIPLVMCLLGGTAAYLIPAKYHSSTSILVQKEETLNPLILYEMAVNMASEDRLKSFNKIVFSRTTVEMLIDSLNLDKDVKNNIERQRLIEKVKKNINTTFSGSDSFEIIYYDSDPYRAQKGVDIIANHFIKTRLDLENQQK
ncbi:MAG: Wzz/FepE/Etk N-terminal domain-containing protein [Gracilimonas sp.]|nr:Wzz/FepE/Etk N-terminal domain-containing protein [Gracilimonas sp.]